MTDPISSQVSVEVLSRRDVLRTAAGAALAGSLAGIGSAQAAGGLIALVHTQAAGDNGPVDSMIGKLKQLASEKNLQSRAIYAKDPSTYESILRSLGQAKANVVVTTFLEMAEPLKAIAPAFPETKFVQLFADPMTPSIANLTTVSYDYYLGCYLSALFGAKVSKSGKLGYVGGVSLPGLNADLNALKAAAAATNASSSVTGAFAGSFEDPAKGREIASQMFQSGVDYIQTDGAATDTGVIQAANEGAGRMVSAISPAQYKVGPKSVIAIVQLDFGQSLYNEASKALMPDSKGGHVATGLGTGVIDFKMSDVYEKEGPAEIVAKAKAVWPEIEKAKQDIMSGALKVPFNTTL